jgi:uncharacterized membrane protein YphA (DoxX/SURF4 family)
VLIAVFLVPTAIFMHAFWREGPETRMVEQKQFFKDLSPAGGSAGARWAVRDH